MELKIKPHPGNQFPLKALLIKSPSVEHWIKEIQLLETDLQELQIFPVPGTAANTLWGCLVICKERPDLRKIGRNELCQQVSPNLFIPERSVLHPPLSVAEIEKLFSAAKHIIHPDFGLAELTEALNMQALLLAPELKPYYVTQPHSPAFVPKEVKSFQVKPVPPEEILKNLEENVFPKKKKADDKPLNVLEKAKLAVYKNLFTKKTDKSGKAPASVEKTNFWSKLSSMLGSIPIKGSGWAEKLETKMQEDFEDLDKRNQKEIDKLMELFRTDPEEALKYAIPLDSEGTTRGGSNEQFSLSKRWFDFSLGGANARPSSGSVDIGDYATSLRKQYTETAQAFLDQKEYHKAAFVYMKLLKNYILAAQALETGKHYQDAATIHLKHTGNKQKAAECYEKGNMTQEAIELFKELNQNEKVGDLYVTINKRKEADEYFQKVVDDYTSKDQYIKASLICKNKMEQEDAGQSLLLQGWKKNKDAQNCLNNYFEGISDIKLLKKEISTVYENDITPENTQTFLQVIKHEYNKKNELSESIKEMAYELIAKEIPRNPSIVSELKGFNANDPELLKDTMRFKLNK